MRITKTQAAELIMMTINALAFMYIIAVERNIPLAIIISINAYYSMWRYEIDSYLIKKDLESYENKNKN